ncbi:conserved hypothetical protein [Neospora caninum Liverpool]|uniref:Tetratricopeptide repeat-containing protein n=1 Tax=Neospora caninum (strain Liverpool) TaxID=572307 RepID=F0VHB7_NEOCL|nr:conserved hypothetical protein [Neospora caninum Liverpool]CBZ53111.1 conserved hypothetical protein [Neospora caninum Liverpool]CEL67097.1 TPA: tetratricopeptide repeat-containing protein [Neospora caninum Liverpool]|eukprot:XP_003883143.1 conserved hypothetical protein [Neospora caninum Liverpool]
MGHVSHLYEHVKLHSPETLAQLRAVLSTFLLERDSRQQSSPPRGTDAVQPNLPRAAEQDETDLVAFLVSSAQTVEPLLRRVFLLSCLPPWPFLPATAQPSPRDSPTGNSGGKESLDPSVSNPERVSPLSASCPETTSARQPSSQQACICWYHLRKSGPISAALRRLGNTFLAAETPRLAIAAYTASLRFLPLSNSNATQLHAEQVQTPCRDLAVILSNRSAAYLRLGNARAALRDGTAGIRLDPSYPKAWFRRASACTALAKALEFHVSQLSAVLDACWRRSEASCRSPEHSRAAKIQRQRDLTQKAVATLQKEAAYASSVCTALRKREDTLSCKGSVAETRVATKGGTEGSADTGDELDLLLCSLRENSAWADLKEDGKPASGACHCVHAARIDVPEQSWRCGTGDREGQLGEALITQPSRPSKTSFPECFASTPTGPAPQNSQTVDGGEVDQLDQHVAESNPYLEYIHPRLRVREDDTTEGRGVVLALASARSSKRTADEVSRQSGIAKLRLPAFSTDPQVVLREYPVASYCLPSENSPLPRLPPGGSRELLGQVWEECISESRSSCGSKAVCTGCFTPVDTFWEAEDADWGGEFDDGLRRSRLCSITLTTPCLWCTSALFCCEECRDVSHHVATCRHSFGERDAATKEQTQCGRKAPSAHGVPNTPESVLAVEDASNAILDCIEQAVVCVISESGRSPSDKEAPGREGLGTEAATESQSATHRRGLGQEKAPEGSAGPRPGLKSVRERSQMLIQAADVERARAVAAILQAAPIEADSPLSEAKGDQAEAREVPVPAPERSHAAAQESDTSLAAAAACGAGNAKAANSGGRVSARRPSHDTATSEPRSRSMNLPVARTAGGCLEDSTRHVARQIMEVYVASLSVNGSALRGVFESPSDDERNDSRASLAASGDETGVDFVLPGSSLRVSTSSEAADAARPSWTASRMLSLAWHLPDDADALCDFLVNAVWIAGEYFFARSSSTVERLRRRTQNREAGEAQDGSAPSDGVEGKDLWTHWFTGVTGRLLLRAALRSYGAVWSNSFGLSLLLDESDSDWNVGRGLYLYASQFNHSCLPNALAVFGSGGRPADNEARRVDGASPGTETATCSIPFATGCPIEVRLCEGSPRGDSGKKSSEVEVTLSYGPVAGRGRKGWVGRQEVLRSEALFECRCKACTTWPPLAEFGGSENALDRGTGPLPLHPDLLGGLPCPRCCGDPALWQKVSAAAVLSNDRAIGLPRPRGIAASVSVAQGRLLHNDALLDAVRALMIDREYEGRKANTRAGNGPPQGQVAHRRTPSEAFSGRSHGGVAALRGGAFFLRTLVTDMKREKEAATGNGSREEVASAVSTNGSRPRCPDSRQHAAAVDCFARWTDSAMLAVLGHSCVAVPARGGRDGAPAWRCLCCGTVWTSDAQVARSFEGPRAAALRGIAAARSAVQKALRLARVPRFPPGRNEEGKTGEEREQTEELTVAGVRSLLDELLHEVARTTGHLSHEVCEVLDLRAMFESTCAHSLFGCESVCGEDNGPTKAACPASASAKGGAKPVLATGKGNHDAAAFEALLGAIWVLSLRYESGWRQPELCVELYKCASLAGNAGAMEEATVLSLAAQKTANRCYGVHHRISQLVHNLREALPTRDNADLF